MCTRWPIHQLLFFCAIIQYNINSITFRHDMTEAIFGIILRVTHLVYTFTALLYQSIWFTAFMQLDFLFFQLFVLFQWLVFMNGFIDK